MTAHETQPGTDYPTERGDRLDTAEPMAEPPQAETLAAPEAADAPAETGSPTADLETSEGTDEMLFADGELTACGHAGPRCRRPSSTIPATVCRRPTAWSPTWWTN